MRAFQIVIDRRQQRTPSQSLSTLQGVMDVLVDGTNVTARIGQDHALPLLRDLSFAAIDLASRRTHRVTVRFYDQKDAWALGLEQVGKHILISVFQGGTNPQVAVFERPVRGEALLKGIQQALDEVLEHQDPPASVATDLRAARDQLAQLAWPSLSPPSTQQVHVEGQIDAPLRFAADFSMRVHSASPTTGSELERSDLHSLLFRGKFGLYVADFANEISDAFVFIVAEFLVREAANLLDAWVSGRAINGRMEAAGIVLSTRLTSEGDFTLGVRAPKSPVPKSGTTFPAITVPQFAEAALTFARAFARAALRYDRTQANNLRMRAFRDAVRDLTDRLRESIRDDTKSNPSPESYRAYANALPERRAETSPWAHGRLRFVPSWQASVPGIDLGSVFLFGNRVVAGGARELACIDRPSGKVAWRIPIDKGVSVAAPGGVARLGADGLVAFHEVETGEATLQVRLAPRVGGMPAGAVVNAPGLPRLLVASEGERHITAIDLVSGEIRWRHAVGRGRFFKVRRAGKLLVISSSESALTALDAATGETVWRMRDRLRFCRPATYDNNALFVIAGDVGPGAKSTDTVLAIDPWTGVPCWRHPLPGRLRTVGSPLPTRELAVLVLHDHRGTGFLALERNSGEPRWQIDPGFAPASSAWLVVDNQLIVNGSNGVVAAIDAATGRVRWQKPQPLERSGDVPRHLEPLLRSGALFVPQSPVQVIRPDDGESLGHVPTDLVADLIRVDDCCNVIVAEESGHVAAYHTGARLTLIRGGG